jgi:hypothetical protein
LTNKKLESLAYRLKDITSLRNLFSELNFDFIDKPVNKDNWNDEQKKIVDDAKIIAGKNDYHIFYIQTNTDSSKLWKEISSKIIKDNHGLCMVCSHNPNGLKWMFSSLSKEFSKSFSETRHVPIDIKPNIGVPNTFVDFLEKIRIHENITSTSIVSQTSNAFDSFALEIHDELTVNVFDALKILSEGIISNKSNDLVLSEQTLEEIRGPTFILLYRIIFILFAEDRGIFPTDQKIYHEKFSFKWLKQEWILKSENQKKIPEYGVQERLWGFFRLIELGSEDLGHDPKEFFMRAYYGRLFDKKINSKLDKWKINNQFILDAISLLTRTNDKKGNYFFLDYSALEIRHLGSIYEHLLEYHLTIENEKIAELPNAKDRKSSGSYYTPKHIVEYIVKNSIEPQIEKIIKENPVKEIQIEKILSLKIIDPAMGSGHFLVGAVEYMATRICEIDSTNGEILEHEYVERKRDVVRRCIYGVDFNPLSVDLARLSLWLETLSSDKPLSFLSAHLKTGNSLIGSNLQSIFEKQTTLFESEKGRSVFKKNLKKFLMFEGLEDDSTSAVKMKLEEYSKMQSKGTIYYDLKFLLDCKIADNFGIKVPNLGDYRAKVGENSLDFYSNDIYTEVKKLSDKHEFFHWELEFPQIFYDENGQKLPDSGFDIVIGNPPYLQKNAFTDEEKKWLISNYPDNTTNMNTASIFITLSEQLCKKNSSYSMIVPKSLTYSKSWLNDRKRLQNDLIKLIDMGKAWKEVKLEQVIFIAQKNASEKSYSIYDFKEKKSTNIEKKIIDQVGILLSGITNKELDLFFKIKENSIPLGKISKTFSGIPYQSKLKPKGFIPAIGGNEVGRYKIKGEKGFFPKEFANSISEKLEQFKRPKIMCQRIVAHVTKPVSRIMLIGTYDENEIVGVNTVNCIYLENDKYDLKSILTILNSEVISWYAYHFIYNDAIRSMDFYDFFISKIPISNSLSTYQILLNFMSGCLLFLNKNSKFENHLDQFLFISNLIVFELYFKNESKSNLNDFLQKEILKTYKINEEISIKAIESFLDFFNSNEIKKQLTLIVNTPFFNETTNFMFQDNEFIKK